MKGAEGPERDFPEFLRASWVGWRLLERKSRKWGLVGAGSKQAEDYGRWVTQIMGDGIPTQKILLQSGDGGSC